MPEIVSSKHPFVGKQFGIQVFFFMTIPPQAGNDGAI